MVEIVLCEIADEVAPDCPEDPSEFRFDKRRWVFKEALTGHEEEILNCIERCAWD